MHFCWVTLPVRDLDASISFYNGVLGLPIASRHSAPGVEMVMLGQKDQPKIELICTPDSRGKAMASDISVGIAVPSMDGAEALMKHHQIPILRGPVSPAPGTCFLFVRDPDGYEVQLVEIKK